MSQLHQRPSDRGVFLRPGRQGGFSLLELTMVLAMAMVASAIAVPTMITVMAKSYLRRGMGEISGLFQNGRSQAVRQNTLTRIRFQLSGNNWIAYVDDGVSPHGLTATTSQVWLPRRFSKVAAPTGTNPTPLDAATCGASITPETTEDTYFTQLGIPCKYSGGSCSNNTAFVYYFTYAGSMNLSTSWAAMCVSPAGRMKPWYWNGGAWAN
jgi:Tfp pilus assembly protein FimT